MKKSKILFIDDEETLASKIKQILEFENFEVQYESSGISALEYLNNNAPDLIICDIMMPEMDGFQFYEAFQKLESKNIPFIFLSANYKLDEFKNRINLETEDFLSKPISRTDLLKAIEKKLNTVK